MAEHPSQAKLQALRNFLEATTKTPRLEVKLRHETRLLTGETIPADTPLEQIDLHQLSADFLVSPNPEKLRFSAKYNHKKLDSFLKETIESSKDLSILVKELSLETTISKALKEISWTDDLKLHLSCFAKLHPTIFENGIYAAILSLSICRELDLEKSVQNYIFRGSLLRDIGSLYMDPGLMRLQRADALGAGDDELLRQHADFSAEVLAKNELIPQENADMLRLHHFSELVRNNLRRSRPLCPHIQVGIYALAEVTAELLCSTRGRKNLTLTEAVSCLSLWLNSLEQESLTALIHLHQRLQYSLPLAPEAPIDLLVNGSKSLAQNTQALNHLLDQPRLIKKALSKTSAFRNTHRVLDLLRRSGHGASELTWWLALVSAGKDLATELEIREMGAQQTILLNELKEAQRFMEYALARETKLEKIKAA